VPMAFMMTMTLWSLGRILVGSIARLRAGGPPDPVGPVALVLAALAVLLVIEAVRSLARHPHKNANAPPTTSA